MPDSSRAPSPLLSSSVPGTQPSADVHGLAIAVFDVGTWPEIACRGAGRNLTFEEWEQFGPADEPYHATRLQWPALG